jgi:transcriptional regulator
MGATNQPSELLPGTLDLLILRTLQRGAMHGYGIAQHLRVTSQEVLQVGESSLYPALQRLLLNGWIKGEWGVSDNNRRARYYELTTRGQEQLAAEHALWQQSANGVNWVLGSTLRDAVS